MAIAVTPDLDDAVLLLNQGEQFFLPTHFFFTYGGMAYRRNAKGIRSVRPQTKKSNFMSDIEIRSFSMTCILMI